MRISMSASSAVLGLAATLFTCVSAKAILGVDIGSLYMKVALVQRGAPLEIVTNFHSKRKTEQLILFDEGTRFYGADASSLLARKPTKTPGAMSVMLGRDDEHPAVKVLTERHYPLTPKFNETRNGLYIMVDRKDSYTPEELISMVLTHAKEMTVAYGKEKGNEFTTVRDCVLTVPSFATQAERQAYLDAATLADFNVLGLIDENTAAALNFGMDKTMEEPKIYLFYNMGGSSLQVSVIKYHSYEVPESKYSKKMKSVGSIEVLGKAWDQTLGGESFDNRLVDYMADHFNREWRKARGHDKDVRDVPNAMTKLRLQANKVKHVLSANQEIPVHMDSLHDDASLSMQITRPQLEELCDDLMARAVAPVHAAIKMANLTLDDIDEIEMIGGGMRVPKVQADLSAALGGKELGLHINSDESMALGAAFFGANISTAFRVRNVGLTDINPFPVKVTLKDLEESQPKEGEEPWFKEATIFKAQGKLGIKKTIAFTHDSDVHCSLDYAEPETLPEGAMSELQRYKISGVADFAKEMEKKGLGKPKVSLQFELALNGITQLVKAEAVVEETYTVEEEVEIEEETVDAEKKPEEGNETAKTEDDADKSEGEDKEEATDSKDKDKKEEKKEGKKAEKKEKKTKMVEKEKKRTHKKTLSVVKYYVTKVTPMSEAMFIESKAKLDELNRKDNERVELEAARNQVESYCYLIKNKLIDDEEKIAVVSTEDQREEISKLAADTTEWLDFDAYDADLETMRSKYKALSEPAEKIWFRMKELTQRPEAIAALNEKLGKVEELLKKWETSMPQVTEDERAEVQTKVDEVKKWIQDKLEEQDTKAPHEEPAFSSAEVPLQTKGLEKIIAKLSKKPKPKPEKKKEEDKPENETATNETATEGADGEEEPKPDEPQEASKESGDDDKKESEEAKDGNDEL